VGAYEGSLDRFQFQPRGPRLETSRLQPSEPRNFTVLETEIAGALPNFVRFRYRLATVSNGDTESIARSLFASFKRASSRERKTSS